MFIFIVSGSDNLDLVLCVESHYQAVINNPDVLLDANASHISGSLDVKIWHRPDIICGVERMSPEVLLLHAGALKTWEHFTLEYSPKGKLPPYSHTISEKCINAANDHNEGKLGKAILTFKWAPNISLGQKCKNSIQEYKYWSVYARGTHHNYHSCI